MKPALIAKCNNNFATCLTVVRRPGESWRRSVLGNRVSIFPLAAKVVVTVTTKLAIPKGHRAGDIVGVGGNAWTARGMVCDGGWRGGDINSHNILRDGIWPVSSPSDAQEYALGVITPNHLKTCSREQFSRHRGGRSLLKLRELTGGMSSPPSFTHSFPSTRCNYLSIHCLTNLVDLSPTNCPSKLRLKFSAWYTINTI